MESPEGYSRGRDAPGWGPSQCQEDEIRTSHMGPLCWRCKGDKTVKRKNKAEKRIDVIDCPICHGLGRISKKKKLAENAKRPGSVSKRRRPLPEGWIVPGPKAARGVEPLDGEELCFLLGHWRIFQGIGGHRWSTDDLVVAWLAGKSWREGHPTGQQPKHCLDLGCGIGTVLLMTAWQFPDTTSLGIEAQKLSASMAERSVKYNGCDDRCTIKLGDIRTFSDFKCVSASDGKYDLVTGTPPYFPVTYRNDSCESRPPSLQARAGMGGMPTCEQSAPARYEFRGGIEAYCFAAARALRSADSRFVVCEGHLKQNHERVLDAAKCSGLTVIRQVNVHGRDDKDALFAVYEMRLSSPEENDCMSPRGMPTVERLVVRHKGGQRTSEYNELMSTMGIPP